MRPKSVAAAVVAGMASGGAGVAWAAGLTVSSHDLTTASVGTPAFYPSSLTIANNGKPHSRAGVAEAADTVTVTYSAAPNAATICASWPKNLNVTVTINDNAAANTGDDTLTASVPPTVCGGTFSFGAVDLGSSGYVSGGSVSFTGSSVSLTTATLTITLGGPVNGSGTVGTVTSGNAAVYTPAGNIADSSGNTIGANTSTSISTVQF